MTIAANRFSLDGVTAEKVSSVPSDSTVGQSISVVPQTASPTLILGGSQADAETNGCRYVDNPVVNVFLHPGEELWAHSSAALDVDVLESGV